MTRAFRLLATVAVLLPATVLPATVALAQVKPDAGAPQQSISGSPMDAAAFEAYVEGRTLTFAMEGMPYGIEEYLPGRRVRWAFLGDRCTEGTWFQQADMICFEYIDNPELQCWHFYHTDRGLRGVFAGDTGTELYEVLDTNTPLICPGPDVGV